MDKFSKNRSFHLVVSKVMATNEESYLFIFSNQGKKNPNNIFGIAFIKSPLKGMQVQAILLLISKG